MASEDAGRAAEDVGTKRCRYAIMCDGTPPVTEFGRDPAGRLKPSCTTYLRQWRRRGR